VRAAWKKRLDDTWQPPARRSVAEMIAKRGDPDRWRLMVRDTLVDTPSLELRRVTPGNQGGWTERLGEVATIYMEGDGLAGARLCGSP
jgi:hypothetical protein